MSVVHVERSRLVQRQKEDMHALEKDAKKKKGAMKDAVMAKISDLELVHAEELKAFDLQHAVEAPAAAVSESQASQPAPALLAEANAWLNASKKELEDACLQRGLSKKGTKEELIKRLQLAVASGAPVVAAPAASAEDEEDEDEEDEDDDSSSSSSGSSSSSEEEEKEEKKAAVSMIVSDEELEKQMKRERIVQKAIVHLFLQRFPQGFALDDVTHYLEKIGVKNFRPETLGYVSLHEFARKQPKELIRYDKYKRFLYPGVQAVEPGAEPSDKKGGKRKK